MGKYLSNQWFSRILLAIAALSLSNQEAFGYSHQLIDSMRSGTVSHVFVTQGVEGEYGKYTLSLKNGKEDESVWKGYGIRNAVGLELMKFVQFSANHTFINMRSSEREGQRLFGSRLGGDVKLVFSAPIGNLEMGMGALASKLDFQRELAFASVYGSGIYYSLGVNYFLSSRVSFFTTAKMIEETLVRDGGSEEVKRIQTKTSNVGLGFNIWL